MPVFRLYLSPSGTLSPTPADNAMIEGASRLPHPILVRAGSREPLEACNIGLNNQPSQPRCRHHPHHLPRHAGIQNLRDHKSSHCDHHQAEQYENRLLPVFM